ncbi:hypothetical protein CRYUN_Cryun24cG0049100 [Craigia yunnanensis]
MHVRRNMNRKKFSFVRFHEWYQAVNAVNWLNGAWLLDQRIMVKHARVKAIDQKLREVK